ncbi:DUF6461 domain-containing protein [Amycolatopsis anabasis]|uniref:DUF6461 domain-containing protein n=1 Tax=Amycolatopsis anabasis TaxID=1840409 RepID=UPI001FE3067F|nr:DUF6461 domain-containing protein [Amycolatopsis anabasis]
MVSHLRWLGEVRAERLLGALELTVPVLPLDIPQVMRDYVGPEENPHGFSLVMMGGSGGETLHAVSTLDRLRPGITGVIAALVAELARHEVVAPLLKAPVPELGDEAAIAARHGAVHLALAVVTAAVVLRQVQVPLLGAEPPVVVGAALGAAVALLRGLPMPPAYAGALLAKRRAEYLLPRSSAGSVAVTDHRFALVEGAFPGVVEFSRNGLVEVVPGGVVVRTGVAEGHLAVHVRVLADPPDTVELEWWDEVVEVSWTAAQGFASVRGPGEAVTGSLRELTPPWPGDYRVRVHACGRDGEEDERYELVVWAAPAGPEVVHKRGDRLGHRLRGEPVPATDIPPQVGYRWVRKSWLSDAATVTAVAAGSPEEVLRGFGADPAVPVSARELAEQMDIDPWVSVLRVGDKVLAVEFNGYQGSYRPVLEPLSRLGRTASMFWNVNAVTRLSFARDGAVLAGFELGQDEPVDDPEVRAALDGLDLGNYRDRVEKGLVAVERFTGLRLRPEDLDRLVEADVGYRILPYLPELYPEARLPDGARRFAGHGPLGEDTDLLAFLPEQALRELAWQAATEAAVHVGLAENPAVTDSLAARRLGPEADTLARTSQLRGHGQHHWMWMTLHRATNPDPLAAAIGALDAARYALGGNAADLLDRARATLRAQTPNQHLSDRRED